MRQPRSTQPSGLLDRRPVSGLMPSVPRWAAGWALALALVTLAPSLRAEPALSNFVLLVSREQVHSSATIRALRSQLADLSVSLDVVWLDRFADRFQQQTDTARRVVARRGAAAAFWYNLAAAQWAVLYLPPEHGDERLVVRSLKHAGRGEAFEAFAVVVRYWVKAIIGGGAAKLKSELRLPRGRRPGARPDRVRFGLGYAFQLYGAEVVDTHGLSFSLSGRLWRQLALVFAYRWVAPFSGSGAADLATARVSRHPFSLGLSYHWPLAALQLGVETLIGLDYVTLDVSGLRADLRAGVDRDALIVSVLPAALLRFPFHRRLAATMTLGAEIRLNNRSYVSEIGAERQVLLKPWVVQPMVLLGLELKAF